MNETSLLKTMFAVVGLGLLTSLALGAIFMSGEAMSRSKLTASVGCKASDLDDYKPGCPSFAP